MKKIISLSAFFVILSGLCLGQNVEGISPSEALDLLKNPDTFLIDVRTIAEYVYVGHPEGAYSLPLLFWDEQEMTQLRNKDFLQDLATSFKKEHTLVFICRSGNRSRAAAQMAMSSGFKKAFNVTEGFEGKKDERGYRTLGGWKNRGLPYTYDLKPELLYRK